MADIEPRMPAGVRASVENNIPFRLFCPDCGAQ